MDVISESFSLRLAGVEVIKQSVIWKMIKHRSKINKL